MAKIGRPPKDEEERNRCISVTITPEQYKFVKEHCLRASHLLQKEIQKLIEYQKE